MENNGVEIGHEKTIRDLQNENIRLRGYLAWFVGFTTKIYDDDHKRRGILWHDRLNEKANEASRMLAVTDV